ncbi:MAG: hemolysin family protein [Streptosporangiaceae bacterium]
MTELLLIVAMLFALACGWILARLADRVTGPERFSAQEVRDLVAAHDEITADERELIDDVFAAGERQLREVLIPRTEVEFLDADLPLALAAGQAAASPHSRFPVFRDTHDEVIGFVHIRDLLSPGVPDLAAPVASVVRQVMYLPAGRKVLPVLSEMRREGHHLAIVIDEYGGTAGIVTLEDLVEELIGDIRDEYDVADDQSRRLHGGILEVDGLIHTSDFAEETGIELPEGPYETVGGYLMAVLGRIPAVQESTVFAQHSLVVTEMEGRRVARVRVIPVPNPEPVADVVRDEPESARIGR